MLDAVFPKRIYSLWYQGLDNAPELVRLNMRRWRELNPSYELVILDTESSKPYLAHLPFDAERLTPQARSDIIRLSLLSQHGGVWTDASVLPLRPLEDWLGAAVQRAEFFAFEREGHVLPLSSWFLAARPNALVPKAWHALSKTYWACERSPLDHPQGSFFVPNDPLETMKPHQTRPAAPYPYFWVHHLFGILLQTDPHCRKAWETRLRIPASIPHALDNFFHEAGRDRRGLKRMRYRLKSCLKGGVDAQLRRVIVGSDLQKLDWRKEYPLDLLANLRTS